MEAKKFLNDDDEESTVIIGDSFARSKSERIRERVLHLESSKIRPIAPRIETRTANQIQNPRSATKTIGRVSDKRHAYASRRDTSQEKPIKVATNDGKNCIITRK